MATSSRLTLAKERELIRRWQVQRDAGALARLVRSLRWLIEHQARRLRPFGESIEDMVQEGELGAVIAIERFDLERTTKLSTYAIHWIRAQMMQYAMKNRRIVRLPSSPRMRRDFFALSRARQELLARGAPPTRHALAKALHLPERRVEMLSGPLGRDLSLDEGMLGERLIDPQPGPEQLVIDAEEKHRLYQRIARSLQRLDARERFVIRERWLGEEVVSLSVVGHKLGVSRERVRQLEKRAQQKLRRSIAGLTRERIA